MDKKSKFKIEIVVLLVLLIILSLVAFVYFSPTAKNFLFGTVNNSIELSSSQNLTPTPYPIPHGKTGFSVGQSDKTVPQFRKGTIDPYDPASGETQVVTISVKHSSPVRVVSALLKTDHGVSDSFPFKLVSGTNQDGIWQGNWSVVDTYLHNYKLTLEAKDAVGKTAVVVITLR